MGFEALYWLPWLEAVIHDLNLDRSRLYPISRGGAVQWYGCPTGVELYAMRTPQDVRVESKLRQQDTGLLKQTAVRPFDRAVYADAAQTLGLRQYLTLHPAWMYEGCAPFWNLERGASWLQQQMRYTTLVPPPLPDGLTLPDPFVAVKFYLRSTFPYAPLTLDFVKASLAKAAEQHPVVILDSPVHTDEHVDVIPKVLPPRVHRLTDLVPTMTAETNLAVQSAVLGRSIGFLGTYGGVAQLALRMRKPVVSFYVDWHGTCVAHKHLSELLAMQMGVAFHVHRIPELPLAQAVTPLLSIQG